MSIQMVHEPYDSVVTILMKLQLKAAKHDFTGVYEAANEIMQLTAGGPPKAAALTQEAE